MEFLIGALQELDSASSITEKKRIIKETGCKASFPLQLLDNHNRYDDVPVDPMHLMKNVVEHVVKLINGDNDTEKVRKQEEHLGRFRSTWMKPGDSKLPSAPFKLTRDDKVLANNRLKQVRVPSGFDWSTQPFITKPLVMKWQQVATHGIMKYDALRGMLGTNQQRTLIRFWKIDTNKLNSMESELYEVLVLLERDFPLSLQVIVFHLLHHLPTYLHKFGPVYNFWMYSIERFNSWITRRVLNRRYPESTVVETYRLSEWAYFVETSGEICDPEATYLEASVTSADDCCYNMFDLSHQQLVVKMSANQL